MFADVAKFADEGYARGHETILLQTPESKRRLRVQCVEVAPGAQPTNATGLRTADELKCWFQARYAASQVRLGDVPAGTNAPGRVYTFCTCVDDESVDARVLVYAVAT